jgi:MFS transporter, DHA3 family, macrolide efflux protein
MFVRAIAGSFHWPAMQASTSLMVPKEQLSRIQGINQMLNGGMNIASAPLGALLVAVLPLHRVMMIDVFSAMLAVLPLFFVAVPQPPLTQQAKADEAKTSIWQDFAAGLRYIKGWTALVLILGLATIINLFLTPASMLVPLLVTRHFGGEAMHLAWMQSASGIGIVAGGLLLSLWGGFKRRILTSMLGLMVMGGASLAMGLMPANAFLPAVAVMFILGLSNPIVNGPLFAALQACVAPEMQGRVFTVIISVAAAMSPLGLLAAGPVADRLGVQIWFLVGGVITLLMAAGSLFVPVLMNFEDGRQGKAEPKVDGVEVYAAPGD